MKEIKIIPQELKDDENLMVEIDGDVLRSIVAHITEEVPEHLHNDVFENFNMLIAVKKECCNMTFISACACDNCADKNAIAREALERSLKDMPQNSKRKVVLSISKKGVDVIH